jgi:hypothetical protein
VPHPCSVRKITVQHAESQQLCRDRKPKRRSRIEIGVAD